MTWIYSLSQNYKNYKFLVSGWHKMSWEGTILNYAKALLVFCFFLRGRVFLCCPAWTQTPGSIYTPASAFQVDRTKSAQGILFITQLALRRNSFART
jgi:hypothetical protein